MISREKLLEYVEEHLQGFEVKPVAGDGLCMLKAFYESLKVISTSPVTLHDITTKLRCEILSNYEFYKQFSSEK